MHPPTAAAHVESQLHHYKLTWCCLLAAAEQLTAQIHAHEELLAQRVVTAAAARRRRAMLKALIMGAVTGVSLKLAGDMLAAAWRSRPTDQRREAAAAGAPRTPAGGRRAVAWSFMSDQMTNTLTGVKFEIGAGQ